MTVYILKPDRTVVSINRQAAIIGFHQRSEEIHLFEDGDFDGLSLEVEDIVVGGIGFVHRALDRLGLTIPSLESIPPSLMAFAGRKMWRGTLGEARHAIESGHSIFVKPLPSDLKLFKGQPMRRFSDLLSTAHLPDETGVDCAELMPFVSEHRVFVIRGKIVGVRHYNGDPLVFPDAARIRAAVEAHAEAPAGYALDVGVCEDGETRLVEVNDGFAVGAYGLPPVIYAALIDARWQELRLSKRR